jgi:cardiolipin synthase
MLSDDVTIYGLLILCIHGLGIITALHAVMNVRTSQGSVAWAISLLTFPYLGLPLYWVFGRNKFVGYVNSRRADDAELNEVIEEAGRRAREAGLVVPDPHDTHSALERLCELPFLPSNQVDLLIDGQETFDAIFAAIDRAKDYVLVQFFIVNDDQLGQALKDHLIAKANEGVRIYFLYDEIGSHKLPGRYLEELRQAGADVRAFHTTKGRRNRFQLNFRNHRKIVLVDGLEAYVGGHNVGDEYMGRDPKIGAWRDTHVSLRGPAVHVVQLSFLEDWYWATQEIPAWDWELRKSDAGEQDVLVLPTGPADELESCSLMFVHLINTAHQRVWIASPYFVPDRKVIAALQLASLRGVDVRIVLPDNPDHMLVYLSAFSFLEETEAAGVKVYRYEDGFMHHKVILVDDQLAAVGTANLDNRSFRLNFEITVLVDNREFNQQTADMFYRDFKRCHLAKAVDLEGRGFWFRLAVKLSRLLAPIQ